MLKSELQHQYWVTKKTFQQKFGKKEDECVVASDAELDAKLLLFKSIDESCLHLHRLIDMYQERLCILAQEENAIGKFLKETGKANALCGKAMSSVGKTLSYAGQQRMLLRAPLLRLHQEVDTFRGRGVADTYLTIQAMERERTEYRAALSWMKSTSNQLDPDSGRDLEKFRKAQTHVRVAKTKFDRLTLDCLEKIDLLAAARCNMFSHTLVDYQNNLLQFATKTCETFKTTIASLPKETQFSFTILKDLKLDDNTKEVEVDEKEHEEKDQQLELDSDQLLFFRDDYKDSADDCKKPVNESNIFDLTSKTDVVSLTSDPTNLSQISKDLNVPIKSDPDKESSVNLLEIQNDDFNDFITQSQSFMPSQLLLEDLNMLQFNELMSSQVIPKEQQEQQQQHLQQGTSQVNLDNLYNSSKLMPKNKSGYSASGGSKEIDGTTKEKSNWFKLFSELDPLANPDAMEQLSGRAGSNFMST